MNTGCQWCNRLARFFLSGFRGTQSLHTFGSLRVSRRYELWSRLGYKVQIRHLPLTFNP